MPRKELLVFVVVLLLGTLDWATTVTSIVFRGASEANPLLAGATSNLAVFSAIKLSAVSLAGLAFYKAVAICSRSTGGGKFAAKFLTGGSSLTVLLLAVVVANNMIAILGV